MAVATETETTQRPPHFLRGVLCTILGAALWGFSGACAQLLINDFDIPVLFIVSVRMIAAGLLFLVILLISKRATLLELIRDRRAIGQLVVFGLGGLFLCQMTYLFTIEYTNAGTATIMQCLAILFVMLFVCARMKRLPKVRELAGLILAISATFIIATHGNPTVIAIPLPGLLWGLSSGLAGAFYTLYPRRLLERWGNLIVTGLGMLVGGIAACIIARPWTIPVSFVPESLAALAALVVIGTFLAFFLYLQGVADIGPVRASMLGAIEPISATLLSWLWLGTQFPLIDFAGFALMIVMVITITTEKPAQEAAPKDTA